MSHRRLSLAAMPSPEANAFVVSLLALWISRASAFPIISEEDVSITKEQSKTRQHVNLNHDEKMTFQPSETILKSIDYKIKDEDDAPGEEKHMTVTEDGSESYHGQTVANEIVSLISAEETESQVVKLAKMKRSAVYKNYHEENNDMTNYEEGTETHDKENSEAILATNDNNPSYINHDPAIKKHKSPEARGKIRFQSIQKKTTPTLKPWFWSWLFKSAPPYKGGIIGETNELKADTKKVNNESVRLTEGRIKERSLSSETEVIQNLESESDYYDNKEYNLGIDSVHNFGKNFEMESFDNFTLQIHNEEVILEEEIMEHNPGLTTTEAVWNTDQFVSETS